MKHATMGPVSLSCVRFNPDIYMILEIPCGSNGKVY